MNRRRFISYTAASVVTLAGADGLLVEPNWVEFTRHEINERSGRSIRFVQITDLHLSGIGGMEEHIATEVNRLEPEFIIITGDSVDRRGRLDLLDRFLGLLHRDIRKYAILGNWEYWGHVDLKLLTDIYGRWNTALLVNRSVVHHCSAGRILITGLDDLIAGVPSIERALQSVEPEEHHIILAHCPQHRDHFLRYHLVEETRQWRTIPPVDMKRYNPGLIFSGHTHGGQVNLLGVTPFLPKGSGDYVKGWFRDGRPNLYVSRGIGTTILPVRLGARPEVAVFTMYL
jgi:predicted MPP superfamily phosphohydrolase